MARRHEGFEGPLSPWSGALELWLEESGCTRERARRCVNAFRRLSQWMADCGLSVRDLDEALIDAHIRGEQERSAAKFPAALQYLPLAKRFLASRNVLVLRGPASRALGGIPRLAAGPLAGTVTELVAWMRTEGYAGGTALSVAGTAARLGAWMTSKQLEVEDLDEEVLQRFVATQTTGGDQHPSSARRIVTIRKFLLATGSLPVVETPAAVLEAAGQALEAWAVQVRHEYGIGQGWLSEQARWTRGFLEQMTGADGQIRWDRVDVRGVNRYVAETGRGYSLSSRRHLVSAIRSLLRWAFRTGLVTRLMVAGVLAPARARAGLPQALTAGQVEAIKAAADRSTKTGRRDYAIVVMISRLGLRAGEMARLRLEDINWHHGQVTVCGKGERVLTLPLPADVGAALVNSLRDPRPERGGRFVFLRRRPPLTGLSNKGISSVVARLAQKAGLGTVHAHRLRHTAATAVLAAGGSLIEARELLGHAHTDTTMVYARTDLAALRILTIPWGQVAS